MKFINIVLLTITFSYLAFSKAITGETKCNNQYCYWVTNEGSALILSYSQNTQTNKILNIPSTVNLDGINYYVNGAGVGAFSKDSNLEEIVVSADIDNFYLDSNAFSECPKLTKVTFNNKSVSAADLSSFSNPNWSLYFVGRGNKSFADDQISKLLAQWGFTVKDYSHESEYTKKKDLYELARQLVRNYLLINYIPDSGSTLVALKVKFATYDGFTRLYRLLAIAIGIPENQIYVATDGSGIEFWNYIFVDNKWYNVNILSYPLSEYLTYEEAETHDPFFLTNEYYQDYAKIVIFTSPSEWLIDHNYYGFPDEITGEPTKPITQNFDEFLNQNQLGIRA